MKKVLLILFVTLSAICPGRAKSELTGGVGVGAQYGGIIGIQGAYKLHNTKLKLAAGFIGVSGGIEQLVNENFSIGIQAFTVLLADGWGFFGNYYIANENEKGWVIGLDLIRNATVSHVVSSSQESNRLLISVGYNF